MKSVPATLLAAHDCCVRFISTATAPTHDRRFR
jgi:hypothetical protein